MDDLGSTRDFAPDGALLLRRAPLASLAFGDCSAARGVAKFSSRVPDSQAVVLTMRWRHEIALAPARAYSASPAFRSHVHRGARFRTTGSRATGNASGPE